MKKCVSLVLGLVLVMGLSASGAQAYDILNNTLVSPNNNATVFQNARTDPIQNQPYFNTYGANWDGTFLTIFSNWSPARDGFLGFVTTADLFIDTNCDGAWDLAVGLDNNDNSQGLDRAGKVYTGPITYSFGDGYTYGKYYNVVGQLIPVLAGDLDNTRVTSVVWGQGDGTAAASVAVNLANLGIGGQFCFLWGSGVCGNSPMYSQAPVPGSLLLLGSGLLGLAGIRRKLKK